MHGKGTFYDPRLDDAEKYPVAARDASRATSETREDLITAKLPALHFYQLSLPTPQAAGGQLSTAAAAESGEALFNGKASCATCHVPPIFTEPGWNLHTAEEIGIDDFQAMRSPDGRYRDDAAAGAVEHGARSTRAASTTTAASPRSTASSSTTTITSTWA